MPHTEKRNPDLCMECGNKLELFELDLNKGFKVTKCPICTLYYIHKRHVLLNEWVIERVTKDASKLPTR